MGLEGGGKQTIESKNKTSSNRCEFVLRNEEGRGVYGLGLQGTIAGPTSAVCSDRYCSVPAACFRGRCTSALAVPDFTPALTERRSSCHSRLHWQWPPSESRPRERREGGSLERDFNDWARLQGRGPHWLGTGTRIGRTLRPPTGVAPDVPVLVYRDERRQWRGPPLPAGQT